MVDNLRTQYDMLQTDIYKPILLNSKVFNNRTASTYTLPRFN